MRSVGHEGFGSYFMWVLSSSILLAEEVAHIGTHAQPLVVHILLTTPPWIDPNPGDAMMSKAAFFMQEKLRRSFIMITDIHTPESFQVRGRLPFPQGLIAINVLFRHQTAADIYAHPYFIEKQSNPDQPSPQLHTTEELQGISKVLSGLQYMHDDSCKLDNTAYVSTDYSVAITGRMPCAYGEEGVEQGGDNPLSAAAGDAGTSPASPNARVQRVLQRRRPMNYTVPNLPEGASAARHSVAREPTLPEDVSLRDGAAVSHAFLRDALKDRQDRAGAVPGLSAPVPPRAADVPLFEERGGGYTVVYNPLQTNARTVAEMVARMKSEERVVAAIVVPTRQAWRQLQFWADAFPDAAIVSSGPIPITGGAQGGGEAAAPAETQACYGYQHMGNGMMGLLLPDADDEAGAVPRHKPTRRPAVRPTDEDPVEALWSPENDSVFRETALGPSTHSVGGLRPEDAHRVRDLSKEGSPAVLPLTPHLILYRVAGDEITSEYVLYDAAAKCLACTDLFHGPYSDLDPLNSWMCRVWFKVMKQGNHKRVDLVPRFKYRQIQQQGCLHDFVNGVDELTRRLEISQLVFAHGSSPIVEDAADTLRAQWGLPPLQRETSGATSRRGSVGSAAREEVKV